MHVTSVMSVEKSLQYGFNYECNIWLCVVVSVLTVPINNRCAVFDILCHLEVMVNAIMRFSVVSTSLDNIRMVERLKHLSFIDERSRFSLTHAVIREFENNMTFASGHGFAFISCSVRVSLLNDFLSEVEFITEIFGSISLFIQQNRMGWVRSVHSLGRRNHRSDTVDHDIGGAANFI